MINHKEYMKEYNKKYYEKNKEKIVEKGKKYNKEHRERVNINQKIRNTKKRIKFLENKLKELEEMR